MQPSYADVKAAADRLAGYIRPLAIAPACSRSIPGVGVGTEISLALEYLQHTGSFKARGAANFTLAHRDLGLLPRAGITIASGGNAGVACAWAARRIDTHATVFLPDTAPPVKVARLRRLGAQVLSGGESYADAAADCERYAAATGALRSHAYDDPYIAAGAGTLVDEILSRVGGLDTILVSVGGGGLFTGVAVAAAHHGIRVVAVEPENCRAFHAAREAGHPVDVPVDSIAADALGARRITPMALTAAAAAEVHSLLVTDEHISRARQFLWDDRRMAVEHAAATAYAALHFGVYQSRPNERLAVILCGANTDPSDLA
ncbi:threonine/serine dehydratase [Nocardia sp. 2]|uniref:Threonine/serine dehydratase n=1 Tax=Nocardia acididurans TaxID=2802282 RepID=A0ABS1MHG0_9NOCA|nr:threonine/serine dehydratase [Nocardia acididurans]MBL1079701.1 threonine/serine dehydratase [Nocardia acididurans]